MNESGVVQVQVYVDILLLVNFVLDFFILWATGKIANLAIKKTRIMLGALCGALYSLVVFFPQWPFFTSVLAKLVCSVLMVWLAYRPSGWRKMIWVLVYMYILSFTMGGAVLAAVFLTDSQPGYIQAWNGAAILWGIDYCWLMMGLVVVFLLVYGGFNCLRKNWLQQSLFNDLTIYMGKQAVMVRALLDTGNQLIDPTTQKPVIVVETTALKKVIPEELFQEISQGSFCEQALLLLLKEEWVTRLSLIPFNSVGKAHGLMVGLRPDKVIIQNGRKSITTSEVVLGLVNRTLSSSGQYRALLHPQILADRHSEIKIMMDGEGRLKC